MKTLEERKAILDYLIAEQQKKGWQIASKTDTSCQLTREKKPDGCLTAILIILFVIPGILYLILMKGTETVVLEIDEQGEIKYTGKDLSPWELEQLKKNASGAETKIVIGDIKPNSFATKDLGLLTTLIIADGLRISEEEVIKLIKTDQLKGKKIGDKYFVRKEDFDEFMKK
jgi:hypothetical protein